MFSTSTQEMVEKKSIDAKTPLTEEKPFVSFDDDLKALLKLIQEKENQRQVF